MNLCFELDFNVQIEFQSQAKLFALAIFFLSSTTTEAFGETANGVSDLTDSITSSVLNHICGAIDQLSTWETFGDSI
jgi:hypothetical protein